MVALLLITGTLVLVLFVLPERYVISAGFRESGMGFPAPVTPFLPAAVVPVQARPLPGALATPAEPSTPAAGAVEPASAEPAPLDRVAALLAEGRPEAAVPLLRTLVDRGERPDLRLLLARTLRDAGDVSAADREYALLAEDSPDDTALALEWALAHAWARNFERAADILERALAREPRSVPLRIELARSYFSLGRVLEASAALAEVSDAALAAEDAAALRQSLTQALHVPPAPADTVQPTRLELAARARAAGGLEAARTLLADALRDDPDDADAWQAYADLLEYELGDFDGARAALLEVARLRGRDADRELRLARLEIWTSRSADAERRLEALLAVLAGPPDGVDAAEDARLQRAEALALLGDLHRWEGDLVAAARSYRLALAEDAESEHGRTGLTALEAEVTRQLFELEVPRRGGRASVLADTDDFSRTDVGVEWVDVKPGGWVWGGAAGSRWLDGVDLTGLSADRTGVFLELQGARWWRSGTVRTGLAAGAEHMRSAWDLSLGASVAHRGPARRTTELRYERGPAHPVTNTLQSVAADIVQDRISLGHSRAVGDQGTLAVSVDAARLRAASSAPSSVEGDGTTRLSATVTAARTVRAGLALGVTARALTFLDPAPSSSASAGGGRALFWDPRAAVSAGPFARLEHELSSELTLTGQLGPGLAVLDERSSASAELVPHLSAELGIRHEGPRLRATLDLFYYQGQFDGYRTYGARLSVGAPSLPALGGSP